MKKVIIFLALLAALAALFFSLIGPAVDYTVQLSSPPFDEIAASEGYIAYCGKDKTVYALDAQTGLLRWRFEGEDAYATPVIGSGRVFVLTLTKKLLCLDLTTGEKLWTHKSPGWKSKPAVADDFVLYGSGNCLVALDQDTGEEAWTFTIETENSINELTIVNGVAYFGYEQKSDMYITYNQRRDIQGGLCAVDLETPKLLWSVDLGNHVVHPPIVTGDMVCVTTESSAISCGYALDRRTGEVHWKTVGATSPPVVFDDIFCCATLKLKKTQADTKVSLMMRTDYFAGFELQTGEQRWDRRHGLPFVYRPCGRKNLAFFAGKSKIEAIDIFSGSRAWSHSIEKEIACPPVNAGGRLILCTGDGQLQALNLD